ncbi:hypothetical protein K1T71_013305 [Dendrolimus kikuchii]|uniref:Uncharacterized protein n=1 Tax=Dendrolimus kikuchii TaxID=765133 RepID=A0ACC1CHR4_9NEOP|nr:hypothetical protein K1T71_013305 [Dendrolimus kikuchii]
MSLSIADKPLIFADDIVLRSIDWLGNYPWRHENLVRNEKEKFEITLVVKDFTPKEISVKTADGYIVVEGKHEEKQDEYGYIARQFMRRYLVPEGCRPEDVKSTLSPDGILTITAPRNPVVKQNTVCKVNLVNQFAGSHGVIETSQSAHPDKQK